MDNIIDGDLIWTTNVSPGSISDGRRLDKYDGNSEVITVGTSDGETLGLIDNTLLGVSNSSKLRIEIGFEINESDS